MDKIFNEAEQTYESPQISDSLHQIETDSTCSSLAYILPPSQIDSPFLLFLTSQTDCPISFLGHNQCTKFHNRE